MNITWPPLDWLAKKTCIRQHSRTFQNTDEGLGSAYHLFAYIYANFYSS